MSIVGVNTRIIKYARVCVGYQ